MTKKQNGVPPRLFGVIHLPALAGSVGAAGMDPTESLARAGYLAVEEARTLVRAGVDGLILENLGDAPFYKSRVPAETVASMAVIAAAVREVAPVPLGINVLRNDGASALAIAAVTGCDWIRVNVLNGLVATDQGLIEGEAASLLRERQRLFGGASPRIRILADVLVKHARTLSTDEQDLDVAIEDTALRAGADAVVISGASTGRPVSQIRLERAGAAARAHGVPLYIGSGSTAESLPMLLEHAYGVIVGSALRQNGKAGAPLDLRRIREYMKAWALATKPRRKAPAKKSRQKSTRGSR